MSYPKEVIELYGDAIEDEVLRGEFKSRIAKVEFFVEGGKEICVAGEVRRALEGSSVEHLVKDLATRYTEFLSPRMIKSLRMRQA